MAASENFIVVGDSGEESRFSFAAPPGQDAWLGQIDIVFRGASRIGLIVPTSLAGILCWRAILLSGRTPIFLHFPTAKLSRNYWRSEIEAAVTSLSIEGIVHHGSIADPGLPLPSLNLISPISERSLRQTTEFMQGSVVQLSSGTTGFRKGVRLTMADIAKHVGDYGQVLGLTEADCIVSWLPLYHDMGFIACFLMPLLAGARIVMVDPMAWVRRPLLLFELIERYRGTICFMPNFGFQVMASRCRGHALDLSSMRHWISCSEPTRIETMHRFMESSGAVPERISNCYAMAENIFAVCQSRGLHAQRVGGAELVSCGTTIPSTSIKVVEGEVRVRSPYSLQAYDGGPSIVDDEGYYATGDLGELIDGELYLLGRKRDLLIQAGRKFLLSDLDHEVGRLVPESAGRICVVEHYNEALGTDEPVCLIEHSRFWTRMRDRSLVASIRSSLGIETLKVEFLPPGFLTKTSSGKFMRSRSRDDHLRLERFRKGAGTPRRRHQGDLTQQILAMFPGLLPDVPFEKQLDSLGLVNLTLLLEEAGIGSSPELSLAGLQMPPPQPVVTELGPVLRVACWVDHQRVRSEAIRGALTVLARRFGIHVHCRFVAAPPAPVLLSDLVFEDYFLGRDDRPAIYDSLRSVLAAFREADLIITDDIIQMLFPAIRQEPQAYLSVSHRFEPSALAQFLAVRWAVYSENHHQIATEVVLGRDLTPEIVNPALDDIEDYLGVPILRLALAPQNLPHTLAWQLRCLDHRLDDFGLDRASRIGVDSTVLEEKLFQALLALYPKLKLRPGPRVDRWIAAEQVHCCGTLANPALVDFVLDRYESFLVLGKPASIPYLSKEADRRGKKLIFRSDLTCPAEGDYDCVLQTGSWGWSPPQTDKPLFQMMEAGWTPQARNVPSEIVDSCPPLLWANGFGSADERGPSRSVPAQPRPGPAIDPSLPNLACGKSATQSSISPWSRGTTPEQDAANAVNGDPTKDYAFHTAEDLNPWWMVDLGAPARLAFIRIFNREAPPLIQWRAAPLVVEGSLTGEDWDLLFETARDSYFSGYSGRQPLMRQIEHPAPVRLVRISIPRREFLHLSEVEIYGVSSSRAWPSAVNAAG